MRHSRKFDASSVTREIGIHVAVAELRELDPPAVTVRSHQVGASARLVAPGRQFGRRTNGAFGGPAPMMSSQPDDRA